MPFERIALLRARRTNLGRNPSGSLVRLFCNERLITRRHRGIRGRRIASCSTKLRSRRSLRPFVNRTRHVDLYAGLDLVIGCKFARAARKFDPPILFRAETCRNSPKSVRFSSSRCGNKVSRDGRDRPREWTERSASASGDGKSMDER